VPLHSVSYAHKLVMCGFQADPQEVANDMTRSCHLINQ